MEFKLTYEGPLFATQRDPIPSQPPKHTQNRHDIRRDFHIQLRRLWDSVAVMQKKADQYIWTDNNASPPPPQTIDELKKNMAGTGLILFRWLFRTKILFAASIFCS
jgi:hypothetical protein